MEHSAAKQETARFYGLKRTGTNYHRLTIDIPTVPNVEHRDDTFLIVNFVDNAIVADANTPTVPSGQFRAAVRSWGLGEVSNPFTDSIERIGGKIF
jgi:hypothetical protein